MALHAILNVCVPWGVEVPDASLHSTKNYVFKETTYFWQKYKQILHRELYQFLINFHEIWAGVDVHLRMLMCKTKYHLLN